MNTSTAWRTLRLLLVALLGAGLVAACGDDGGEASESGSSETTESGGEASDSSEGTYPVTIEHVAGSTTIEERPERIVSLNVQWTDALLAMGVTPVGYVLDEAQGETDLYPWQEGLLEGAEEIRTNGTIPFEQIAALDPDLILVTWLVEDESDIETLQQIAPTIPNLSDVVDPWQDHIEVLGQVLGEPDKAAEVIADVEGRIEALAAELPGLAGKTYVAANYVEGDGIYVVADPEDGAARLFYALGMAIPPAILDVPGAEYGRVQLSLEQASLLDADFIGILTNGSDPSVLPGWDQLAAVQTGALVEFELADVVGLNTPSALSLPYVMELVRPALEIAAGS